MQADLVAMKDPVTNDIIFNPKVLKQTALDYCANLLQNHTINPEFACEIYSVNLVIRFKHT